MGGRLKIQEMGLQIFCRCRFGGQIFVWKRLKIVRLTDKLPHNGALATIGARQVTSYASFAGDPYAVIQGLSCYDSFA